MKKYIKPVIIIFAFYALLFTLGITCPIKFLTGISCPGCGLTRAWISVIQLDFVQAFQFHPLFWLVPLILIFIISNKKFRCQKWVLGGCALLFVLVYFYRMFFIDSVVVVLEPSNNIFFKIVDMVF